MKIKRIEFRPFVLTVGLIIFALSFIQADGFKFWAGAFIICLAFD